MVGPLATTWKTNLEKLLERDDGSQRETTVTLSYRASGAEGGLAGRRARALSHAIPEDVSEDGGGRPYAYVTTKGASYIQNFGEAPTDGIASDSERFRWIAGKGEDEAS